MNKPCHSALIALLLMPSAMQAQQLDSLQYGDFENWVTRHVTESVVIGGKQRQVYEIGPESDYPDDIPYTGSGDSPWATSNAFGRVSGVTVVYTNVVPYERSQGNRCAKIMTRLEHVKVLGFLNVNVMTIGWIFLGEMIEPADKLNLSYADMDMGIPYTRRPKAFVLDYLVEMPFAMTRTKATGIGSQQVIQGCDSAAVVVMLQRRWEDGDGHIHAMRVATGGDKLAPNPLWHEGYNIPLQYGDCSRTPGMEWLGLRNGNSEDEGEKVLYARNSRGEMQPILEEGWDNPNAVPTHLIVIMSSGCHGRHIGTNGLTLYVDNVALAF